MNTEPNFLHLKNIGKYCLELTRNTEMTILVYFPCKKSWYAVESGEMG